MNSFDNSVFYFLDSFARVHSGFDQLMVLIVGNNLLKGGFLVMILWWCWFQDHTSQLFVRRRVIITLISCLITLAIIRIIIMIMPFHPRPMHEPSLSFIPPDGLDPKALENFSSFPSDHAGLFFALATGIYFISKKAGIITIAYVLLAICFPRLYLGYHYATDILAGILIGILTTIIL
ncbi:MAG: phosphatase PAP2 family protein, partial [Syntrophothermus sp.]